MPSQFPQTKLPRQHKHNKERLRERIDFISQRGRAYSLQRGGEHDRGRVLRVVAQRNAVNGGAPGEGPQTSTRNSPKSRPNPGGGGGSSSKRKKKGPIHMGSPTRGTSQKRMVRKGGVKDIVNKSRKQLEDQRIDLLEINARFDSFSALLGHPTRASNSKRSS